MSTIIDLLSTLIESFLIILFLKSFTKTNKKWPIHLVFVVVYFLVNVSSVIFEIPQELSTLYSLAYFAVIVAYALVLSSRHFLRGLLGAVLMQVAIILSNTMTAFGFSVIFQSDIEGIFALSPVFLLINYTVSRLLLWLVVSLFRGIPKHDEYSLRDTFLLLLFSALIFVELFTIFKIAYDSRQNYTLYYVITGLLIAAYVGVLYLTENIINKERLLKDRELQVQALEFEKKNYGDIKRSLDELHKIRHDIKNRLFAVKTKAEEDDLPAVKQELDALLEETAPAAGTVRTGNRLLDYILNSKMGNVKNKTVSVFCDIKEFDTIEDIDLSIMVGNVLDNAVEALSTLPEGEIKVSFYIKANHLNFICGNTVKESVLLANPELKSTKKSAEHGYGLRSVREIAAKYNGLTEVYEKNDMFYFHILWPQRK